MFDHFPPCLSTNRIGLENAQLGFNTFHLNDVVVECPDGKKLIFPCNKWLDRNSGDGKAVRELFPVYQQGKH